MSESLSSRHNPLESTENHYEYQQPDATQIIGSQAVDRAMSVPDHSPAQEFTREQEQLIAANLDLMFNSEPGGMAFQMSGESMGGNARSTKIDTTSYAQTASNGYMDQTGKIIEFTNSVRTSSAVEEAEGALIRISVINAHANFRVADGRLRMLRPDAWTRNDQVMRVYAGDREYAVGQDTTPTEPAIKILLETARRYNQTPQNTEIS